jgi:hypothetical protein
LVFHRGASVEAVEIALGEELTSKEASAEEALQPLEAAQARQ